VLKVANRGLPENVIMVWPRWRVESISTSWDAAPIEEKSTGSLRKNSLRFL
jgi:hypothetical protein